MSNFRAPLVRILVTIFAVTGIFVFGFIAGTQFEVSFAQDSTRPPQEVEEAFRAFWQTFNLIQSDYIDDIPTETLVDGALNGMVNALNDQFSAYMDPEIFPLLNQDLEGEISGIGVVIRTNEANQIEVVDVLLDSPAMSAGVRAGDIFVTVDGQDLTNTNQTELAALVRGQEGTIVNITFLREGEPIEFAIERARIIIPNVESERLENDIGHVRLNQFSPDARAELDRAIEELDPQSLEGLILDVRGNGGGLLDSAIDVASLLIPEGTVLIEDFGFRETVLNARNNAMEYDFPIVLLVDESSASASELVAGAWQDYGLVTVMGEVTFGKGTVQTWHTLVNGGGVRLTIARWYTPERNSISGIGITPDLLVNWDPMTMEEIQNDVQLQAAAAFLRGEPIEEFLSTPEAPAASE